MRGPKGTLRLGARLTFLLERFLVGGAGNQLLAVALLIGLVALLAGGLMRFVDGGSGSAGESIWWAFLRLTDPGYLGDDSGALRRTVSTIVTIFGYVLFMGSLVAIMTQWLNTTIRRLEQGRTPIFRNNHVVVLGWTARTAIVVNDLMASEWRVRRFLRRHGARRLHIALLTEEVTSDLAGEIRTRLGENWEPHQITLRSGSGLQSKDLSRVDFANAAAILVTAGDLEEAGPERVDTRTIKTLLTLSHHPALESEVPPPLAVAEILDGRRAKIARAAYQGPLEIVSSDLVLARLFAQVVLCPGLSLVYDELLTRRHGAELFAREIPAAEGTSLRELQNDFPDAVILGAFRGDAEAPRVVLNPSREQTLRAGDRVIFAAHDYDGTEQIKGARTPAPAAPEPAAEPAAIDKKILILGWNYKVPALLAEFASHPSASIRIDIASAVPVGEREQILARRKLAPLTLRHLDADYTAANELAELEPHRYDNIVFLGSDWLDSGEESDSRTIAGYLMLRDLLAGRTERPDVAIELLDPDNTGLLGDWGDDVIVSPLVLGRMLSQVVLRPELNAVFEALFMARGPSIVFRDASDYGCSGKTVTLADVAADAERRGETALGLLHRRADGSRTVRLIPRRDHGVEVGEADRVVVLATQPAQ